MKRTIKLAVAAAVALTVTSAFATNGDNLIAVGAKSRGMGGIGIGMSHGAESGLSNPAMITTIKVGEISFGGTVFMPDVETDTGSGLLKSAADFSVIPEVATAQKVSDNLYWGIGMYGTAGMGTDYRNDGGNMQMVTNLQLMQFALPIAYKMDALSIAIAPVIQYGALDMDYVGSGTGVGQDLGLGYILGAAYTTNDITVGATYKSAIDMTYDGVIAPIAQGGFGQTQITDSLEQPAEYGIGASYKMGESTVAIDFKTIKWSNAKGYREFDWDDQNVLALGYEYDAGSWAARVGYNHSNNPIQERGNGVINVLNLLGFPAIVKDHYTLGGSYDVSKTTSLDLAYVYAPSTSVTYNAGGALGPVASVTTKHSQDAVSAQVNFKF